MTQTNSERTDQAPENELQTRLAALEPQTIQEDDRSIEVIWSTGAQVQRRDWMTDEVFLEELSLTPGDVRLDRLNTGAPLLNNHNKWELSDIIGVVVPGSVRLDGKKATARVRFSARADVEPVWQDVKAGIIRNISVGYRVHKWEVDRTGPMMIKRAKDWEPYEISAVAIPADEGAKTRKAPAGEEPGAMVARSDGIAERKPAMPNEANAAAENTATESVPLTPATSLVDAAVVREEATKAERKRVKDIRDAVRAAGLDETVATDLVDRGVAIDEARQVIIDKLAAKQEQNRTYGQHAVLGDDPLIAVRSAIEVALLHRYDARNALSDQAREYRGMGLIDIARECLNLRGVKTRGLSRYELASLALGLEQRAGGMMSSSDFPFILANVANKTLRQAYEAAPQTFRPWTRQNTSPDFKTMARNQLSNAPALVKVNEHGEFKRGSMSEAREQYALATYGRTVAITRQAIINDDMGAFTRIPGAFGVAAANLESDTVWGILTANAALADGVALFHATHGNLAGAGAAIDVTTLGAGRSAMRQQKDLDAATYLNLMPRYLLVPTSKETVAQQYTTQTNIIYTKGSDFNPFANSLQVIAEPRLDANSTTAWYLASEPGRIDTIEYCYLEGQEGVYLESRVGFDIDGMELKARLDFAAKAIDFRGLYKNAGA